MEVIKVNKLTKRFDEVVAVDRINFTIHKGEIFGFLGPNGAGKTTTISILSTLLSQTSGDVYVNGYNVKTEQNKVRKSIGVVFQDPTLDEELTAKENMRLHSKLYGMKNPREKIDELLDLLELGQWKNKLVKTFSGGMKRRLEIARGLLHKPSILFLDEPTLGLDPQTRNYLWEYIKRMNQEKQVTIILTTHYMDEADKLSDRAAIIDQGKIVAMDTPGNLKADIGDSLIRIHCSETGQVKNILQSVDWINGITTHNGFVDVALQNAEKNLHGVVKLLSETSIDSVSVRIPTLEEVFLNYTGRSIREEEAGSKDRLRQMKKVSRR